MHRGNMSPEPSARSVRLVDAPRLVLGGLADFMSRRRSPSFSRKREKEKEINNFDRRKTSAPAGLHLAVMPALDAIMVPSSSSSSSASIAGHRDTSDLNKNETDGNMNASTTRTAIDVMQRPRNAVSPIVRIQYSNEGKNIK
ncbi:unnamed protein product [Auanema sp. JU1783]|nr:unnamed protein product [Auanema sp. JU1783]